MLRDRRGDSSASASSSNVRRGWSGLGIDAVDRDIADAGRLRAEPSGERRLMMAGESSRSSERRRAAVPRKSGLAKFDHLPCQPAVCARGIRVAWRKTVTGLPDQRRLAELAPSA